MGVEGPRICMTRDRRTHFGTADMDTDVVDARLLPGNIETIRGDLNRLCHFGANCLRGFQAGGRRDTDPAHFECSGREVFRKIPRRPRPALSADTTFAVWTATLATALRRWLFCLFARAAERRTFRTTGAPPGHPVDASLLAQPSRRSLRFPI